MQLTYAHRGSPLNKEVELDCEQKLYETIDRFKTPTIKAAITFDYRPNQNAIICKIVDQTGKVFILKQRGEGMNSLMATLSKRVERLQIGRAHV